MQNMTSLFNPQKYGEMRPERILGTLMEDISKLDRYRGKNLAAARMSWQTTGCLGQTYTPGECWAVVEEQLAERRYLGGILKCKITEFRPVVTISQFFGSFELFGCIYDEETREISKQRLNDWAKQYDYTLAWTDELFGH